MVWCTCDQVWLKSFQKYRRYKSFKCWQKEWKKQEGNNLAGDSGQVRRHKTYTVSIYCLLFFVLFCLFVCFVCLFVCFVCLFVCLFVLGFCIRHGHQEYKQEKVIEKWRQNTYHYIKIQTVQQEKSHPATTPSRTTEQWQWLTNQDSPLSNKSKRIRASLFPMQPMILMYSSW